MILNIKNGLQKKSCRTPQTAPTKRHKNDLKSVEKGLFLAESFNAFKKIKKTQKNPKNFEKRYWQSDKKVIYLLGAREKGATDP